ncbi:MAG: NUDIX hydrolase [Candidatus Latescibacterota bacterium]|nr:NUDIX hydrolase [Candidatus Latescibacterota bacterium]
MQLFKFSKLSTSLAILAIPAVLAAEKPAGTVVYFKDQNETYILLAEHAGSSRGWAAFGGGDMETETYLQTAARKTHEETRGYFATNYISKRIDYKNPLMDGNYATFFVEVPFVPIPVIQNKPLPDSSNLDAYTEREKFAWIPLSIITDYFSTDIDKSKEYKIDPTFLPKDRETDHLWPIWLKNMRKGFIEKKLPWQKK